MTNALIQAPVFILLLASLIVSFVCGLRNIRNAALMGWIVFVLAYIYSDLILPTLAIRFLPRDVALELTDQPGTAAAMVIGWIPACLLSAFGRSMWRDLNPQAK
jgi:hypothetical protein